MVKVAQDWSDFVKGSIRRCLLLGFPQNRLLIITNQSLFIWPSAGTQRQTVQEKAT